MVDKFIRADTNTGFEGAMYIFSIPFIPKYPDAWWCISEIWIYYTTLKMFFGPVPVFTINARRSQTYLLDIVRKWSIIYMEFGTSLYISFVDRRKSLIPVGSRGFMFHPNRVITEFTEGAAIWNYWLMFRSLYWIMSICACKLIKAIQMYQISCVTF